MSDRSPFTGPVLVTGALGTVGAEVVRQLSSLRVETTAFVRAPEGDPRRDSLPGGLDVRHVDLTDRAAVATTVADVQPRAIIHLAGVIPPQSYRDPAATRAGNVDATHNLLSAATQLTAPCRFVHASSIGIFGSRNPHTMLPLEERTSPAPRDHYGQTKLDAERLVQESSIEWTVLRIAVVVQPAIGLDADPDRFYVNGMLPGEARTHVISVGDAARAFIAATSADCARATLLVGGDDTCRLTHEAMVMAIAAATGMRGAVPRSPAGDPTDDASWFVGDWMDTTPAQAILEFQRDSWSDILAAIRTEVGWRRRLLPLSVPIVRPVLETLVRRNGHRTPYADPWGGITAKWGETATIPTDTRS